METNPNTPMWSANAPIRSRVLPGGTLAVMLALIALHHWYAMTYREVFVKSLLLLTLIAGFAAGGTIYPPLFYAGGPDGRHLPVYMKVISGLFAACGLGVGFYLLFVVYAF